jgi:predicted nucleic acid-binding protein
MTVYPLDIIIPVWNRPVEVRAALASFVAASPMARLVMVNNGSERETESILEEFAEALDDRALLVATDRNIGSIAALNLGLSRASAPLVLVTTPFARVKAGWFDSVAVLFEQHATAGSAILLDKGKSNTAQPIEVDHGCFEAMVLRRSLYEAAGGFDEGMDGGEWALRDFARRSLTLGQTTFALPGTYLTLLEYGELGSASRREERVRLARDSYVQRWGEPETFLLNVSESLFGLDIETLRAALLQSARQGNRLIVTADSMISKMLIKNSFAVIHENVTFQPLPRFFSKKYLHRIVERAVIAEPSIAVISEAEMFDNTLKSLSMADFLEQLHERSEFYSQRGSHA